MRSATQNNGKITSQTDSVSGEQVVYAYDALNRLASAGNVVGNFLTQNYTNYNRVNQALSKNPNYRQECP